MARLDKSIDDINKTIAKLVNKKISAKTGKLKSWKGKKVITKEEWFKRLSVPLKPDQLDYIPDSFIEGPPFLDNVENESSQRARQEWYNTYLEYLEYAKEKDYGRHKCKKCILNPDVKITPTYLRDFMVSGLKEEMSPEFPCKVLDMFECPYGEEKENLLFAKYVCEVIHEALRYGRAITSSFDDTYHIDYEKKTVGYRPDSLHYTIEETLGKIIVPTVPVRTEKDIHEILTSTEKLDKLLEQYTTGLATGNYDKHNVRYKSEMKPNQVLERKEIILEFFKDIRDSIKLEEMGDHVEGLTEIKDLKSASKESKSGTCPCGSVAKIHCMNCNKWVCLDHWKEHGVKTHNFVE